MSWNLPPPTLAYEEWEFKTGGLLSCFAETEPAERKQLCLLKKGGDVLLPPRTELAGRQGRAMVVISNLGRSRSITPSIS